MIDDRFKRNPNRFIDHTNLKPISDKNDIEKLCEEAIRFRFRSVCVNPYWVKFCKDRILDHDDLSDSFIDDDDDDDDDGRIRICTVVGFPLGSNSSSVKAFEIQQALKDGATEIDLVINIGLLFTVLNKQLNVDEGVGLGSMDEFETDFLESIEPIVRYRSTSVDDGEVKQRLILKVIIETSQLTNSQIGLVSRFLSGVKHVDFIKTSTGFNGRGASLDDIELISKNSTRPKFNPSDKPLRTQIKASGGIKSYEDSLNFIRAGVTRLGTSSGVRIMDEWEKTR
ncbi:hypothetical protein PPACK8108_LOCUS22192 [Phakopsora pachyrhizi]|uniref:deoxyribose-phosphate aldolase n=1 Tax=Phakopsora pachyrhizi TaxID=170000 RepID=A0AAV0BL34_PHAPC|nr:hypothetical protein PPACK8108_LOCUS22192 [Phakopsora pachyrhizi]